MENLFSVVFFKMFSFQFTMGDMFPETILRNTTLSKFSIASQEDLLTSCSAVHYAQHCSVSKVTQSSVSCK